MQTIGTLDDDGRTLVITRILAVPVAEVWATLTESERLGRWFGTWTGDPSTGSVMVTMNAEGETPTASRYEIQACEAPRVLAVRSTGDAGGWSMRVDLHDHASGTELVFRHTELDPGLVAEVGPGWDWYLDRLAAVVAGTTPPDLDDFETRYLALGPAYAALVEDQPH